MNRRRGILFLVAACMAGLVSALVAPEDFDILLGFAAYFGLLGLAQSVYAVLLARRTVAPSRKFGMSPLGQAMQGTASLLMCAMLVGGQSWLPGVGWFFGISYVLLLAVGHRVEHKSCEQLHAV